MVCFRYVIVNTVYKGNNNSYNNNNSNNNKDPIRMMGGGKKCSSQGVRLEIALKMHSHL